MSGKCEERSGCEGERRTGCKGERMIINIYH